MAQIVLENVDWKLLREQKAWLVQLPLIRSVDGKPQADRDMADGLIHFLDYIQDQAAEQLGPMVVFGKKT